MHPEKISTHSQRLRKQLVNLLQRGQRRFFHLLLTELVHKDGRFAILWNPLKVYRTESLSIYFTISPIRQSCVAYNKFYCTQTF